LTNTETEEDEEEDMGQFNNEDYMCVILPRRKYGATFDSNMEYNGL